MSHDENIINGIFEKYEKERLNDKVINWDAVDNEFKNKLNISYKSIKSIINEQYQKGLYVENCYGYAKAFKVVEFHPLIKNYELAHK